MNRKWLAATGIALLVALPVTVTLLRAPSTKEVEVERAVKRALAPSIIASGTLVYGSQATLVSEVIARVDEVLVKEGDLVSKGQLLLRLDSEASTAEIAQLRAKRRQAELDVERQEVNRGAAATKLRRYEELRRQGLIESTRFEEFVAQKEVTDVEVRVGREAVKQALAQLQAAQQRLTKTEIRAPIGGKVMSVSIKLGETAIPSVVSIAGSTLLVIADTRSQYAEINVDEADIGRIAVGQDAKIVPAAFADNSLLGKVEQVAAVPRQNTGQSRSYTVRVRLETQGTAFRPGMSCRAEIAIQRGDDAKNVSIPVQAVQYDSTGIDNKAQAAVFVLVGGKGVKREVRTGIADDKYVEVLTGLKPDEIVVVGPAKTLRFLRDGEALRTKSSATADVAGAPPRARPSEAVNP